MIKKIPVQQLTTRQLVVPLALCQFIASYACTNMNVAISDIAKDLSTSSPVRSAGGHRSALKP